MANFLNSSVPSTIKVINKKQFAQNIYLLILFFHSSSIVSVTSLTLLPLNIQLNRVQFCFYFLLLCSLLSPKIILLLILFFHSSSIVSVTSLTLLPLNIQLNRVLCSLLSPTLLLRKSMVTSHQSG